MIDELTSVTSAAVSAALDALAQRQQLIATNLANANSSNYAVRDLEFEDTFKRLLADDLTTPEQTLQALRLLQQDINAGAFHRQVPAHQVELDAEMVRLNETVIRYQALIEGLGKYGSLARMAISGETKS